MARRLGHIRETAVLVTMLSIVLVGGCSEPPQLGSDEATLKTADALWTAITSRDDKLLNACEEKLRTLGEAGDLPQDSREYLQGVIATARAGNWDAARTRLKKLIKAQRREDKKAVKHGL